MFFLSLLLIKSTVNKGDLQGSNLICIQGGGQRGRERDNSTAVWCLLLISDSQLLSETRVAQKIHNCITYSRNTRSETAVWIYDCSEH